MYFIIKPHPEVFTKSESVRKRFTKILECNIRNILKRRLPNVAVYNKRTHIEVSIKQYDTKVIDYLSKIPGINYFLEVVKFNFDNLDEISEISNKFYNEVIENKSFCVRVKRRGNHNFSSTEVERKIGSDLFQSVKKTRVDLKKPEVAINIEIDGDEFSIVKRRYNALGGFPLGTQESVLSLISGGYDSSASSYQHIRRGSKVHFCFFNLGGPDHERSVKEVAHFIWNEFGSSAKVNFITVDLNPVIEDILEHVSDGYMGVVLKRMFMKISGEIAKKLKIAALVTGEALGQVSSQTLSNLKLIDLATDRLILRPLITSDKEEIIQLTKNIGTEELCKSIPEYCSIISKKPTIKADFNKLILEESKVKENSISQCIEGAKLEDIRQVIATKNEGFSPVNTVSVLDENEDVLLDIRSNSEIESTPLDFDFSNILEIPFYKLVSKFPSLDQSKNYVLYCDRQVMSRLQAIHLIESGFKNVAVFEKTK